MISRRPREIAASVDEHIVVEKRHVAGRRRTPGDLPLGVVGRGRVQSGVEHYDAAVADLTTNNKRSGILRDE